MKNALTASHIHTFKRLSPKALYIFLCCLLIYGKKLKEEKKLRTLIKLKWWK